MFHKAKCFNHQLVQFKIKSILVNRDAKESAAVMHAFKLEE